MLIIPAIDLKNGKVVRLVRGRFSEEVVYAEDPVAVALRWQDSGAGWLHLVDLEGALGGSPRQAELIGRVAQAVKVPVQAGGGVRSTETVEHYLKAGVRRVILGTRACVDETFFSEMLQRFGDRIAAALDVREGRVAVEGWVKEEGVDPLRLADRLARQGVRTLIYTDTSRDGTLAGPGWEGLEALLRRIGGRMSLIASGGVGSLEDLTKLKALEPAGLSGVIVGKALYDGKVDLKEAIRLAG